MGMNSAILITDNTALSFGFIRYLGAYRIAHELEKVGIHTTVVDRFIQRADDLTWLEPLLHEGVALVGISTTFLTPNQVNSDTRTIRTLEYYRDSIIYSDVTELQEWFSKLKDLINRFAPRAKIIVGGSKAPRFLEYPLNQIPEIDYLTVGSADFAFGDVGRALVDSESPKVVNFKGRKILDTKRSYGQRDHCPRQVWFKHWNVSPGEALPIEIARGCVFNCKFCYYDKKKSTRKSFEVLREEFIENYENYGTQFYHFVDDCLNDHREKIEALDGVIRSLPFKIEWVAYARFDVALRFPDTVRMMVDSGAKGLYWGVESLTYDVARRAGKGALSEKIKQFILDFKRDFGDRCLSTASLISGLPGETRESWLRETEWLLTHDCFDFLHIGSLLVAPYSQYLDSLAIDYADYSRNPKKYGFEVLRFSPYYWRHETMDLFEAEELARMTLKQWHQKRPPGLSEDIWHYPIWRGLGFSENEIRNLFFENSRNQVLSNRERVLSRLDQEASEYFKGIISERSIAEKRL